MTYVTFVTLLLSIVVNFLTRTFASSSVVIRIRHSHHRFLFQPPSLSSTISDRIQLRLISTDFTKLRTISFYLTLWHVGVLGKMFQLNMTVFIPSIHRISYHYNYFVVRTFHVLTTFIVQRVAPCQLSYILKYITGYGFDR